MKSRKKQLKLTNLRSNGVGHLRVAENVNISFTIWVDIDLVDDVIRVSVVILD